MHGYRPSMPVVLTLLAVLALGLIVLYVVREQAKRRDAVDEELTADRASTLEYDVPTGQDPTVILAALETAGYTATVDPRGAHQVVIVACPHGVETERERVRAAIESADVTTPEDGVPVHATVVFRDE